VISTVRFVAALALTLALGISGIAFAGSNSANNDSSEDGSVKPKKLDKKKFKPVTLKNTTTTDFGSTPIGEQANAEELYVDFGKNIKFKTSKAATCSADIADTTPEAARAACPAGSVVGTGTAKAVIPGLGEIDDPTALAFNGPGSKEIRFHIHSDSLDPGQTGANTQTVETSVVKSPAGKKYGQRISAPQLPDLAGDEGGLTDFSFTVKKKSKVATARCKAKKHRFRATHVYDDGASQVDTDSQKCKRKKKKK
jgi:hypothetical protein